MGKWVAIWLMSFMLLSCYESQDGCLDTLAKNYDVTADNECDDCCKYGNLNLAIAHEYNGVGFNLGDTLANDIGERFVLIDFLYVLSGVDLMTEDGPLILKDSILLSGDEVKYIQSDIAKFQKNRYSTTMGTFRYTGMINQISFQYGLPSSLLSEKISNEKHWLNSANDSLYTSDGYITHRLKVGVGEDLRDTMIYEVHQNQGSHPYSFTLTDAFIEKGTDVTIKLTGDYSFWFDGVRFSEEKAVIESKIFDNASDFIN